MTSRVAVSAVNEPVAFAGTRAIIVTGLVVGAVLGFGGNFVEVDEIRSLLYGLSAVGLIVSSVLLALEHASSGYRLAASAFAVFALAETRVLNPFDAPGGEASFAAGVFLYAPALLMFALSMWAPLWVRIVAAVAAVPFAAHALIYFGGGEIESTGPLAGIGYALFTVTVIGWILAVLRSEKDAMARPTVRES